MAFRSSQYCSRYEYCSFQLVSALQPPVANQAQKKAGHKFTVDNFGETTPLDWYNAYIEADVRILKINNNVYTNGDNVTLINGMHGLIDSFKVDYNGVSVINTHSINHATNIKNLIEFSKPYSDSVGPSMFHFPDTSATAASNEFTATANQRNQDYNAGFAKRRDLLNAGRVNNAYLPLNRYGFFASFRDRIAPPGKVDFDITFVSDLFGIYKAAALGAGKYYSIKLVLWVPKMTFNLEGEKLYLAKYGIKQEWTYLKEDVVTQADTRQQNGVFRITPGIKNPRHVFIWVLKSAKINNQDQNPFIFDTYRRRGLFYRMSVRNW